VSSAHRVTSEIPIYELHRWLNPFARQRAVMVTVMKPDEIEHALRPHLFSFTRSHLPHEGLYGSLKPWGFTLKRAVFQQPFLTVRYEPSADATRLELTVRRSLRGVLGWGWDRAVAPLAAIYFMMLLFSHDILGLPYWVDTSALWQAGNELYEQPAIWLVMAMASAGRFINAIIDSYRSRIEVEMGNYKQALSDVIDAREASG
jgi:hypothetical protein